MRPATLHQVRTRLILAAAYFYHIVHLAVLLYASPLYWKQEYHTSALNGRAWLDELIVGHPDRIKSELGMRVHVFLALVAKLRLLAGLTDSRYISADEQVAIFLYTCVTGLSVRHVGERFQHSNETISKYLILFSVASVLTGFHITDIFDGFCMQSCLLHSITTMSDSHLSETLFHVLYKTTPNFFPSLKMQLAPWTVHI